MNSYLQIYCGTCRRIREILIEAPWSNFDLLASLITLGIGAYLLVRPDMFSQIGGVYATMAKVAPERYWGILFFMLGGSGLAMVLWCKCPPFLSRLAARMGTAFCLITFALNNLSAKPAPLSSITYTLLALWALWGIFRTRASGR